MRLTGLAAATCVALLAACRSAKVPDEATSTSTVTAPSSNAPAAPADDATVKAQTQRLIARFAAGRMPVYPPAAQELGEQGTVEIAFEVRHDGAVVNLALVSSSGSPRLDAAAMDSARTWRFLPRTGAGGVERLRHHVVFRLDER
jgi:protein TonB